MVLQSGVALLRDGAVASSQSYMLSFLCSLAPVTEERVRRLCLATSHRRSQHHRQQLCSPSTVAASPPQRETKEPQAARARSVRH